MLRTKFKTLKKLICAVLVTLILSSSIFNSYTGAVVTAQASGVTAAANGLRALIGAAIAYAGYNATKKQHVSITSTCKEVIETWVNAHKILKGAGKLEGLSSAAEYFSEIKTVVDADNVPLALLEKFCNYMWNRSSSAEKLETTADEFISSWHVIDGGKNDDDIEQNDVVKTAGGLVFSKEIVAQLSDIAKEVIDSQYNAEYIKSKNQFDWEALGFHTDTSLFTCADSSIVTSNVTDQTNGFIEDINSCTSVMVTDKFNTDNYYSEIIRLSSDNAKKTDEYYQGDVTAKFAWVSFYDYSSEQWTTFLSLDRTLFSYLSQLKAGSITYEQFKTAINSKDLPVINPQDFYGYVLYADNYLRFDGYNGFENTVSSSAFSLSSNFIPSDYKPYTCTTSNTKILNCSKTLDWYCLNFGGGEDINMASLSTSALNGTVQPVVAESVYSNTASEIDKAESITVDPDVDYSSTDAQIADIASDNDLALEKQDEIIENTDEISEAQKGIWESVKEIPVSIWNYFKSTLKDIPAKIWSSFKSVLTTILRVLRAIKKAVKSLPASIATALEDVAAFSAIKNAVLSIPSSIDKILPDSFPIEFPDSLPIEFPDMSILTDIKDEIINLPLSGVFSDILEYVAEHATTLTDILTDVKAIPGSLADTIADVITGIEDIPAEVADSLSSVFAPDTAAIADAFAEVKKNFGFVDDFKTFGGKLINLGLEPHDYITVYNWNKAGNKYDSRDSYVISFSWYAPYKTYVDPIFIAFVYIFFIWRIFIKLPSIINGLGGGIQTIDNATVINKD